MPVCIGREAVKLGWRKERNVPSRQTSVAVTLSNLTQEILGYNLGQEADYTD
jgi:hypothetical protein